ncbi:YHYH protein [Hydrogenophaga sp. PAMC20947]|uniref:YHYH protein n=1 Tax=Hydrogenophaga sp. PAMC20947 TaxID=2565558 RepID=UPI00109E19E2|nr:YHYH protein [Hydrogenophaga sp. PAMC20947]QCB46850.1 YHYH protein [Hydrogenophaga sp. PAMC20947]
MLNIPFPRLAVSGCVLLLAACVNRNGQEVTQGADATPTAGVACEWNQSIKNDSPSVRATSKAHWSCTGTERRLSANGLPDHAAGTFPNPDNPNTISAQDIAATFTLAPVKTQAATRLGGPRGVIGFVLNGVKIDAGTNGGCNDAGSECDQGRPSGQWRMEALGITNFRFGTDSNNAHVQPNGEYHYHGMPEGFIALQNKGQAMTLIGWAADGFPIYARWGYSSATDAASPTRAMQGSYGIKSQPDASRPPVSTFPMGTFMQDYEYVEGLGDLDECNGRTGVTPEFPQGIYHYFATDSYPYLQRCVKGALTVSERPRGGPPPQGRNQQGLTDPMAPTPRTSRSVAPLV